MHVCIAAIMAGCFCAGCGMATKLTPETIYRIEARHHPGAMWTFLGSDREWHYFEAWTPTALADNPPYRLRRWRLPEIHGFSYRPEDPRRAAADISVSEKQIVVDIDGYPAHRLRHKSGGFVTPEPPRKPKEKRVKRRKGSTGTRHHAPFPEIDYRVPPPPGER